MASNVWSSYWQESSLVRSVSFFKMPKKIPFHLKLHAFSSCALPFYFLGIPNSFIKPTADGWKYTAEWNIADVWSLYKQLGVDPPHPKRNLQPTDNCQQIFDWDTGYLNPDLMPTVASRKLHTKRLRRRKKELAKRRHRASWRSINMGNPRKPIGHPNVFRSHAPSTYSKRNYVAYSVRSVSRRFPPLCYGRC